MGKRILSIALVLVLCVASVVSYTLDQGPPASAALISDGTNNCGAIFLDAGFVLTTSECASRFDFTGGDVNVSPATNITIDYPVSTSNPFAEFGGANGVALIRLVCPAVRPSQIADGTVRFAEIATPAFEANSCFPQGAITSAGARFAGLALLNTPPIIITRASPSLSFVPFELEYVGPCGADNSTNSTFIDGSEVSESENQPENGIFNCFRPIDSSRTPLDGSPIYVLDENRVREIVLGVAFGESPNGDGDTFAYVRVSRFINELASFLVEATTGRSSNAERLARFQRQQAIRVAIQSGERLATLPASSSGSTSSSTTTMDATTRRGIEKRQQEAFFMETLLHSNWHQHTDGRSSILSTEHLQAKIQSKYKRAPASAFVCPGVAPGCSAT
eukprot:TRINITY_DN22900_c0_g1_i1.p1 TRINITY_DN22900_c0_g1~~TRINITY_DN22900_c0_g1_i1.p1  ORF type:complete len:391 (-),score=72.83 TRINITY_DN22900_c0_g1_i1:86-1258(-)